MAELGSPVIGNEVEVDPGHVDPHHLQALTGELWVAALVGLQDLEPGLHQVRDALLPHAVLDQRVPASLLQEEHFRQRGEAQTGTRITVWSSIHISVWN